MVERVGELTLLTRFQIDRPEVLVQNSPLSRIRAGWPGRNKNRLVPRESVISGMTCGLPSAVTAFKGKIVPTSRSSTPLISLTRRNTLTPLCWSPATATLPSRFKTPRERPLRRWCRCQAIPVLVTDQSLCLFWIFQESRYE